MPMISNQKELDMALSGILKELIMEIVIEATAKLENIILEEWYLKSPARSTDGNDINAGYTRTMQFLEAVTHTELIPNGRGYSIDVWIDHNKIHPQSNLYGSWKNAHMSLDGSTSWGGKSIGENLVAWIENGQGSTVYPYSGIGMFAKTSDWLEKELPKIAIAVFKRHGLDVIVT